MPDESPTYAQTTVITDVDGVSEVQSVTIDATGGTFTLSYEGEVTDAIAENAAAATVLAELLELGAFGVGDLAVAGSAGGPYTVTFQGDYANQPVETLVADDASLTGGGESATVAVATAGKTAAETDAVQIPDGENDGTGQTSPLAGENPAEVRAENPEDYGDEA